MSCPAESSSPAHSRALSSCICNAGWSGPDGGACTACGMYRECPPVIPGERRAEWLMLSKREDGQAGSPRSPHKHGKRASWGISLFIPSEAPPAEVRRYFFHL
jgi:hypothetical protein